MAGNKLEQLIRDFLEVGRELIEILRSLDNFEEDEEDQPTMDVQSDNESPSE